MHGTFDSCGMENQGPADTDAPTKAEVAERLIRIAQRLKNERRAMAENIESLSKGHWALKITRRASPAAAELDEAGA